MDRINKLKPARSIQQQTPEELKKLADSFSDLPKEFQLSSQELEMLDEETFGKPVKYGTPAAAIAAMRARLAVLKIEKAETLSALETCEDKKLRKTLIASLDKTTEDITAAQTRLDSYEFQQKQEN